MGTVVGRATGVNFGNVREYYGNEKALLEQMGTVSALLYHRLSRSERGRDGERTFPGDSRRRGDR